LGRLGFGFQIFFALGSLAFLVRLLDGFPKTPENVMGTFDRRAGGFERLVGTLPSRLGTLEQRLGLGQFLRGARALPILLRQAPVRAAPGEVEKLAGLWGLRHNT
jgi:hypothetical protein